MPTQPTPPGLLCLRMSNLRGISKASMVLFRAHISYSQYHAKRSIKKFPHGLSRKNKKPAYL
eukprot:1428539-Prymnesium_polylepis.1